MTAQLTDERIQVTTGATDRGRVRETWRRIRSAVREMNDTSRHVVELQAPWSVDQQWHSR